MTRAEAFLNLVIEATDKHPHLTPADAREALYKIEGHDLAIGALRLMVENPKNEAALDHARKLLALVDARPALIAQRSTNAAPQVAPGSEALTAPPPPVGAAADVSDLA